MGLFKPVETKENLVNIPEEQKIVVTFTRQEYEYLMDLIERYEQAEPQLTIDKERLKRPKKQDETLIQYMQRHLLSTSIIKERMLDALPKSE